MTESDVARRAFAEYKRRVLTGKSKDEVVFARSVWVAAWLESRARAERHAEALPVAQGLTEPQLQQFESADRILARLPQSARRLFWTTPKWSLGGATPLAALVIGRYEEVRVAAAGFAER